jgi:hypothetical protein
LCRLPLPCTSLYSEFGFFQNLIKRKEEWVYVIAPRFTVGWILISPGALVALIESQEDPRGLVSRHMQGDWGDVRPDEWAENEYAVRHGGQLFSVYHTRHGRKLWVITEPNRYSTTILLPEESPGKGSSDASQERSRSESRSLEA